MLDNSEIVRRILEAAPEGISLIVLFGSRARGDHSEASDLDIAISTTETDAQKRFDLRLQVISALEGPETAVDVVLVEDANWTLRYRIARDGVVLFQRNPDSWSDFIEEVLIRYPDYRIFEQRLLRETLGGL